MEQNNKPKKTYKSGVLSISLWEKEGIDKTPIVNFSFQRAYKDDKDNWQHTQTIRTKDIPRLIILLQEAYKDQILSIKE